MTTPRDNQRKRLYGAERVIWSHTSEAARRLLVDTERVPSTGNITIEACQDYVDHLTQSAWFQRRWGLLTIRVKHKTSGKATGGYGRISLPPFGRCEAVILHEVAHNLSDFTWNAPHGPEFAGMLLTLVEHRMGKDTATLLRRSYREHRVRVSMRLVPDPTRPVREPRRTVVLPSKAVADRYRAERVAKERQVERRRLSDWYTEEGGRSSTNGVHVLAWKIVQRMKDSGVERLRVTGTHGVDSAFVADGVLLESGIVEVTVTVDGEVRYSQPCGSVDRAS